ncbi:MAG TPA: hypothetical protein VGG49_00535 [Steroidobacteraceae bacterium]|jgi:hypothetical protein
MATLSRFSTSTIAASNGLVPWLAARGPLAYSPVDPPARDYFFQYSWILPGIFDPEVNLREHRYFGGYRKDAANFLFDFWGNARNGWGKALQQYCELGDFSDSERRAPLAAYHHVRKYYDTAGSLLIQHGSYQWISREDQPHIEQGEVLLYRGIGEGAVFRCLQFEPDDLTAANREIWRRYLRLQAEMLSDSVLSFNTIHDRVMRSETEGLRHGTWLGDTMATQAGLDIESPGFAKDLWHAAQQAYSLDPVIGVRKFGPHHVVMKTMLSNIRLTTFFAGESEVRIIDPSRICLVDAVGCQVKFIPQ